MTQNISTEQRRVNRCKNLRELCSTLNEITQELLTEDGEVGLDQSIDLADLPTFGGPTMRHTEGVWSWDKSSFLTANGEDHGWVITSRCETCHESPSHCGHK
jgi:hypothetical protein